MVHSRFSRRERISEAKGQKRLFLSIGLGVVVLISLLLFGIPALINMSTFISNFNHGKDVVVNETQNGVIFPPVLQPIYSATNSATINITGYAEVSDNVSLYLNGDQFGSTLVSKDGTFSFPDVQLKNGSNTIYDKAQVTGGKESSNSNTLTVLYKKSNPKLELAGPDDNATVNTEQKMVVVSGLTDPEDTVTVNDHIVVVNPDGSFSYQQSLNDGDNTINIVATDSAGNQTKTTRHVKYSSPS